MIALDILDILDISAFTAPLLRLPVCQNHGGSSRYPIGTTGTIDAIAAGTWLDRIQSTPFADQSLAYLNTETFVDKIQMPTFLSSQWQDEQTGGPAFRPCHTRRGPAAAP